jgi:hypothetical protein
MKLDKEFDVTILGYNFHRRKVIYEKLIENNITVNFIDNSFSDTRDSNVGKSLILLNIHAREPLKIYESIRCERWRFAGMVIVSELCLDKLPDGIIECAYDDVVKVIKNILTKLGYYPNKTN